TFDVPLTQQFTCGAANPPTVTVSCSAKYTSTDVCPDVSRTEMIVPCCDGSIVSVNGVVPQGSLTPTHIDVDGACFGCASDQVTVTADKILPGGARTPIISPATVPVDQKAGFRGRFPIVASGVRCGDEIAVD